MYVHIISIVRIYGACLILEIAFVRYRYVCVRAYMRVSAPKVIHSCDIEPVQPAEQVCCVMKLLCTGVAYVTEGLTPCEISYASAGNQF